MTWVTCQSSITAIVNGELQAELLRIDHSQDEGFDIPIRHGLAPGQYHMERRQSVAFESKINHEVITLSI